MTCPRCGQSTPERAKFCLACGAGLTITCPRCQAALPDDARYCIQCGHSVAFPTSAEPGPPRSYTPAHLAERILTNRGALEGERKQVSIVFCDLSDSTGLAVRVGPESMHDLLGRFFELALAEVHRYEGTVNQFLGDGFM